MRTWLAGVRPAEFDRLRSLSLAVHGAIVVFVALGWLMSSRLGLYLYLLLLPLLVMQWILNGGSSIVDNFENLNRCGRWSDSANRFEGALFKTVLARIGVPAGQGQITTILCLLMLTFWFAAFFRMVLIVVPPPA